MIILRKSDERRRITDGNQATWMTFDWENNTDPLKNGFGVLEILNEEILTPGTGFYLHTHKYVVIVTYLRDGVIIYKAPLVEPDFLEAKDFHRVNAAPDTKQYVYNISKTEAAHVFQSGFTPVGAPLTPPGMKKFITHAERQGVLKLVVSPDGRESSIPIQQDVHMYSTLIHKGKHMVHELRPGRSAWLHVVKGEILLHGHELKAGDGAGLYDERSVSFTANKATEVLLFDLGGKIPEIVKTFSDNRQKASEGHQPDSLN